MGGLSHQLIETSGRQHIHTGHDAEHLRLREEERSVGEDLVGLDRRLGPLCGVANLQAGDYRPVVVTDLNLLGPNRWGASSSTSLTLF
jgi:hypothetical protein